MKQFLILCSIHATSLMWMSLKVGSRNVLSPVVCIVWYVGGVVAGEIYPLSESKYILDSCYKFILEEARGDIPALK
jgi:hypothetical protein